MSLKRQLIAKWAGLGAAFTLRQAMSFSEIHISHYDRSVDPALPDYQGQMVYVFWHEYIAFPIALWRNYPCALLVSQHRDAEPLVRAAHHFGFDTVRGSTTRGGSAAIRELKRKSQTHNIVMTPDGPTGPRRSMAMGPIYLASRLGLPIVPVGFGFNNPWRLPTWDKFAFPKPGCRARAIMGPRFHISRRAKKDELEESRVELETMLNSLTTAAEDWATSNATMENGKPFIRYRKANGRYKFHDAQKQQCRGPHYSANVVKHSD